MPNIESRRLVVAGCARDCAPFLPQVFANIDLLGSLVADVAYLFIENDSADSTKSRFADYSSGKSNFRMLSLDGVSRILPQRTMRLAMLRNTIREYIRAWNEVHDFDYLVLLDMDGVNAEAWNPAHLRAALEWLDERVDTAGIFANQKVCYYDMWALRHDRLCPGDIWEAVFDTQVASACTDAEAFERAFRSRTFDLPIDSTPVEVESAFGGLGIYRLQDYLLNPAQYSGDKVKVWRKQANFMIARWQQCEHVSFNRGFSELGKRLFILPTLVNADMSDFSFNPSAYKGMLF